MTIVKITKVDWNLLFAANHSKEYRQFVTDALPDKIIGENAMLDGEILTFINFKRLHQKYFEFELVE